MELNGTLNVDNPIKTKFNINFSVAIDIDFTKEEAQKIIDNYSDFCWDSEGEDKQKENLLRALKNSDLREILTEKIEQGVKKSFEDLMARMR